MVRACIDTNVWISGILFGGPPAEVVSLALKKKFQLVLSNFILDEMERNLVNKFDVKPRSAKKLRYRIAQIADLYNPTGTVRAIADRHVDNLILETAVLGKAKYIVTGDRRHLLPLKIFRNTKLIDPASFMGLYKP